VQFDHVHLTVRGKVAIVTLSHPATINALSSVMMASLNKALDHVETGGFRALILTGEGRGFCSGADLSELPKRQAVGAGETLEQLYHPALRRLRDLKMPLITAINGPAVGIGVSFALMGDLIVAARSAYFLLSFSGIGLVPDGGATWLLPRLIGLARAREMALLAEKLPAERAMEWGLINRVTDDVRLMDEALALAQRLVEGPAALRLTRKLFWESPHSSYEEQLDQEKAAQGRAGATKDFWEGLAAFHQKRPPHFTGE
jgi:2-(1,2-epoxy-1,2-dihydrophenyl)acetyl-CoA isomerase